MSVRLSNHDSDTGIGLVRYVHSLIGLAETTISNRDVDDQFQCILAKDKALSTKGSDLNRLHQDVLQLMIILSQKYLSLRSRKANDYLDADPCMDDRTMLSEDISSGSSEHDDNYTWDQEISNTTILLMTHSTMTFLTTKRIKMTVTASPFTVLTVLIK
jgi:hypothetical protein